MKNHVFGGKQITTLCCVAEINVMTHEGSITVHAFIVPDIVTISQQGWSACKQLNPMKFDYQFADNFEADQFEVQLLIGMDFSWSFLKPLREEFVFSVSDSPGLVVQDILFGLLVSGPLESNYVYTQSMISITTLLMGKSVVLHDDLHSLVEKAFSMDSLGLKDLSIFAEKDSFHKSHQKSISFDLDINQYVGPLPWKEDHPPLTLNLNASLSRLKQVRERLIRLNLFDCYSQILKDHLEEGFVEKIPVSEDFLETGGCHYLA